MTIFQSVVYPDNERCAQRVFELSNDCILYYHRLASQKPQFDSAFAEIDTAHRNLGLALQTESAGPSVMEIFDHWAIKTLPSIAKPLLKAGIKFSLAAAGASAIVQAGGEAPSALRPFLKAPSWLLGNKVAQGLTAAVVADLIISAVQGANQRSKLQNMIREMVAPRVDAARLVRQNDIVLETLRSISAALAVINRAPAYKAADAQDRLFLIDLIIQNCLEDQTRRLSAIDDVTLRAELTKLDSQRGSFTEDDSVSQPA